MKRIFLTSFITLAFMHFNLHGETLFSVSSKDRDITAFDFVVTEVERNEAVSVLNIPNFQERSASASRWMMCVYTELALERGAEYWSSIYTDNSGDIVTIVLPETDSLDDPAFKNVDTLGTQPMISTVGMFKRFCGLN
ncbi:MULTISPECIES: hypothetical protein [unclassified Alteromonas]|uniref:hypothetical protein n=1 Tax=unclassified Alteromonas TaxID=2614992 RepID=UPI000509C311|nr:MULTISPECIES: hypothetical protein [unclassified Alteromonas]